MNYKSVQDILSADITNMEIIRENKKITSGNDTITTATKWFKFQGSFVSNIYVNAKSYIGFGSDSKHLQVNNRNSAMYSLYKEEGTLYGYYKFLKIRWEGYSDYSYSWSSCSLIYDVILWDTGAISLHMIKIPSTYNTGTYALNSNSNVYRYSVNSSQKNVTFTPVPNYSSQYTVSNDIINLAKPFENRFLIRSNTNYYTIVDNALSAVDVTDLTSNTFLTFGTIDIPNVNFLFELPNPELLYWVNNNLGSPKKGLTVTGTPSLPQFFYYKQRTLAENVLITKAKVSNAKGNILFTITFDGGQTWNYYNGTDWVQSTSPAEGMRASTLKNITQEQWTSIMTSNTYQFRGVLMDVNSEAGQIYINTI